MLIASFTKRIYHATQDCEGLVDLPSLFQPLSSSVGELLALRPGEVHKMEL